MIITYDNVGNVKHARIEIKEGYLNLKYGTNGTGKSTISKALKAWVEDEKKAKKTFAPYIGGLTPSISIDGDIDDDILLFDDKYIEDYLFDKNDISNNTFEIIRSSSRIRLLENQIQDLVKGLQEIVNTNYSSIEPFAALNTTAQKGIKPAKNGKKFNSGPITNNLFTNNSVELIPSSNPHKKYIENDSDSGYIAWFTEGAKYQKDDNCPYCLQQINEEIKLTVKGFIEQCQSSDIKGCLESRKVFKELKKYAKTDKKSMFDEMITQVTEAREDQISEVNDLLTSMQKITDSINIIRGRSIAELAMDIKNGTITNYKIDESFFTDSDNPELAAIAHQINAAIDEIIKNSKKMNKELDEINAELKGSIQQNKLFINDFLEFSGMPYLIDVSDDFKTILYPKGISQAVDKPKEHLSYGERNSLALLLFAVEAINKNPDLIIIDDPISSFDGNKKFAILHQLFADISASGISNLRGKTVLMLTHDFEIVNDIIHLNKPEIENKTAYILLNKGYELTEKVITWSDIDATQMISSRKAQDTSLPYIVRVINARRNYEIRGYFSDSKLLSSLLHNCSVPTGRDGYELGYDKLYNDKILPGFDYYKWLDECNKNAISDYRNSKSNYEKLIIARFIIIKEKIQVDSRIWNFLSNLYHIENDTIFSLKFDNYDIVPDYIVAICDDILKKNLPGKF